MKQLKFMLAAVTAIGLATAAQADAQLEKKPISSENFDGVDAAGKAIYSVGDNPAAIANSGFTFEGDDNESTIVIPDGEEDKALKVNTGTDPLLRKIDPVTGNAVALDATKKVYIDTKVQFTVTPFADKDNVTATAGDKLMIYLLEVPEVKAEDGTVTTPASTKLMVKAAGPVAGDEELIAAKDYEVSNTVVPNEWYDLKVVANTFVVDQAFYPYFRITITDKNGEVQTLTRNDQESFAEFDELDDAFECFPSLALVGNVGSGVGSATLDFVGFAGEGVVDDLVFSKDVEQQTSVDFTFAWTTDGISAVKYAIGDATEYTTLGDDKTIADLDPEATIKIQIVPAEWYAVKKDADLEYTASEESADLDDFVVAVTTKEDGDNVVVKPNTSATEVGITAPVFADADATQLGNVLTWAKKGSVTIEQINSMSFTTTGDPAGATPEAKVVEEAYLLGCSPAEVEAKKEAFVFEAFDPQNPPTAEEFAGKGYNGEVVIEGATTLSDETTGKPNWATGHEKPAFYRARLKFK